MKLAGLGVRFGQWTRGLGSLLFITLGQGTVGR